MGFVATIILAASCGGAHSSSPTPTTSGVTTTTANAEAVQKFVSVVSQWAAKIAPAKKALDDCLGGPDSASLCPTYSDEYSTMFKVVDPIAHIAPALEQLGPPPQEIASLVSRTISASRTTGDNWTALNSCQDGVKSSGGNVLDVAKKCGTQLSAVPTSVDDMSAVLAGWTEYGVRSA